MVHDVGVASPTDPGRTQGVELGTVATEPKGVATLALPISYLNKLREEVVALLYCLGDRDLDHHTLTACVMVRETLDDLECELDPTLREKVGGRL